MTDILRSGNTERIHWRLMRRMAAQKARWRVETPVPVLVAGIAIIATRCLGMVMLIDSLGLEGLRNFVDTSSRSWDLTLLFLASLTVLFVEIRCGFALMRGRRWARWCYVACQLLSAGYLFLATWRGFYPEMFALPGSSSTEIISELIMHKSPDIIVLALLYLPPVSRRFFMRGR